MKHRVKTHGLLLHFRERRRTNTESLWKSTITRLGEAISNYHVEQSAAVWVEFLTTVFYTNNRSSHQPRINGTNQDDSQFPLIFASLCVNHNFELWELKQNKKNTHLFKQWWRVTRKQLHLKGSPAKKVGKRYFTMYLIHVSLMDREAALTLFMTLVFLFQDGWTSL